MGGLLCRKDDEVICISVELGQGAEDTLQGLCLQKPKNVSRLNISSYLTYEAGNQILHEELCLFSKLKWNHLIYLRLSMLHTIKMTIISGLRDASTCLEFPYPRYDKSSYVL
jgi:hypothetical protein